MNRWLLWIVIATCVVASPSRATDESQNLHYVETPEALELTVPAGGIWLVIPSEGFERLRPLDSGVPGPRSFDLIDRERDIEIFGAFDSDVKYPGLRRLWDEEREQMKLEEAPEPRNVEFSTEGDWETIAYQTNREGRLTYHLRAHVVRDQTWIDVHITASGSGDESLLRQTALSILRGLALREG